MQKSTTNKPQSTFISFQLIFFFLARTSKMVEATTNLKKGTGFSNTPEYLHYLHYENPHQTKPFCTAHPPHLKSKLKPTKAG